MAVLTVRGVAAVPAEPDEASVAITLSAVHPTAEQAYRGVAERVARFEALCEELGIERAQRSTAGLSVQAEVEWVEGRSEPRGYRATSRTQVRLRDAGLVARLLEQAVARAEAHVEGPWWTVDIENPARFEACRRAAAAGRRRAEAYAESLGVRLGALEAAAEPGVAVPQQPRGGTLAFDFASAAEPVPMHPGEHVVTAAVELTYALEQP